VTVTGADVDIINTLVNGTTTTLVRALESMTNRSVKTYGRVRF
jgi:hypothetical protein